MSISSFTMAISLSSIAAAMINHYPRFEDQMDRYGGYHWSSYEVTTSDGYVLTTFQIHANPDVEYKGSILVQHSDGQDGASWMYDQNQKAFQLHLADHGYNVWIGNNRGTEYSQRHKQYDAAGETAREYWDFTWTDMQNDDKANIEEIRRITGEEKIYYLGYSQGSTQLLYALAQDNDWFSERLHRAVMLAPCFYRNYPTPFLESAYENSIASFRDFEIYVIGGPNWIEYLKKICEIYDSLICMIYSHRNVLLNQPISVKAEQHWWQNGILQQFNEFQENWSDKDRNSKPIDVSKIKDVPMSFFVGTYDTLCQPGVAYEYTEKMPTKSNIIERSFLNQYFWAADQANEEDLMTLLLEQLAIKNL